MSEKDRFPDVCGDRPARGTTIDLVCDWLFLIAAFALGLVTAYFL